MIFLLSILINFMAFSMKKIKSAKSTQFKTFFVLFETIIMRIFEGYKPLVFKRAAKHLINNSENVVDIASAISVLRSLEIPCQDICRTL